MIIIDNISEEVLVKIPNNLEKKTGRLSLHSTESKKDYTIEFVDGSDSGLYYEFNHQFSDIPVGEYEYSIDGNKGLLVIQKGMKKKVYEGDITFKSYEA